MEITSDKLFTNYKQLTEKPIETKMRKTKKDYNDKYMRTHKDKLYNQISFHCIFCNKDIKYFNKHKHLTTKRHKEIQEYYTNEQQYEQLSQKTKDDIKQFLQQF